MAAGIRKTTGGSWRGGSIKLEKPGRISW